MRALLLAGVGVFALGGAAFANDTGGGSTGPRGYMDHYAAALGVNIGQVAGNRSSTGWGQAASVGMTGSFQVRSGVMNVNQNAGANAMQQNAVAIAYVEGCNCEVGFRRGDGDANTVAVNAGAVGGRRGGNESDNIFGTSADAGMNDSFGSSVGIAQVNQNAGANSLQQNATAVAYVDRLSGERQTRDAWAISANIGTVTGSGNDSNDYRHAATANIAASFGSFTGVANVNQNAGANSLQQNSAALSAVEFCNCATRDLSTTIAAAGNVGSVTYNRADADFGSARAGMTGSFNGGTGIAQVNQNAGANSLMQNSVAVGAVYNR